jgi:hypothetical protein
MERKSPALLRATQQALTGRAQATIEHEAAPEPEKADPFADNGHEGNRRERRRMRFRGHGYGHRTSKGLPTQASQKRRRKIEAAGRKAARKGR